MASNLVARDGHDFGKPNLDGPGIFYITFTAVHTVLIAAGLFALWVYRDSTAIRIRSLPVIYSAVIAIHAYVCTVLSVYPANGLFKCGWEFWAMNTFFPLGIGLFQASNVRLLSYYEAQRSLIHAKTLVGKRSKRRMARGLLRSWSELSTVKKTYVGIGVGLVVQLLTTFFLFFGSRLFHASYGLFSTHVNPALCRRGPEWIPSVFWHFLWSTVFGPWVLLRIRHVKDTRYWGLQTRLAIIACLPGTPLWVAFTYSDDSVINAINKWWVPPAWFLPGLITMQWVSIVFPLLDMYKNKAKDGGRRPSTHTTNSQTSTVNSKQRDMYSMASLEMQLEHNVNPLLRWAAQKEFTAENVVFLRSVRDFKRKWAAALTRSQLTPSQLRERYEEAALIFFTLVNPSTARFNINIDSRTYNELAQWFAGLRYESLDDDSSSCISGSTQSNVVTPWADAHRPSSAHSDEGRLVSDPGRLMPMHIADSNSEISVRDDSITSSNLIVPAKFNAEIFDGAYESVKRDVFLNTWPRFVDAGEIVSIAESDITFISVHAAENSKYAKS